MTKSEQRRVTDAGEAATGATNQSPAAMTDYDPKSYWNAKARSANGDPVMASCGPNPHENRCMHRVQQHALATATTLIDQQTRIAGKLLLDYGCGAGRWVDYFQSLGARYAGVDISEEMIALCRKRYPNSAFTTLEGTAIPQDTGSQDIVVSIAVIHHNRPPQQQELLAEITRVLKPGGYLFLFEGLGTRNGERVFPHPMREWIRLVEQRGYVCILQRRYGYSLLSSLFSGTVRRLHIPRLHDWKPRLLLELDAVVASHLSSRWPVRRHTDRGAMLFRRRQ